ncbi:MAG: dimethylmenaquinone methyltransferase [Gemmatimonadota bacterium]|nr:MAG: dimethylmenaquinone methyltransferase [Gemmatimonadota bacterium]
MRQGKEYVLARGEWHQQHWKIVEDIARPQREVVERLGKLASAQIADSMGRHGVVHYGIKPLCHDMRVAGPAVTVLTRPGDALFVQKAIEICREGDVVVIDASGYRDVAALGERLAYYFQRKGISGIVCDGAIRDSQGIAGLGLAVFSRGVCIKIFGSEGPGAINVPVQCGGVVVNPGDVVIGDRDGVVVVPREDSPRIAELAEKHLAGELERVRQIEDGQSMEVVYGVDTKIGKWM